MTRILLHILVFVLVSYSTYGQANSLKPADLVENAKLNRSAKSIDFFTLNTERSAKVPQEVIHFELFNIDKNGISSFLNSANSEFVELNIPSAKRADFRLQLVEVDILSGDGYVKTMPSNEIEKVSHGKHFRGIVAGQPKSIVSISIFEDEVMGFISESGKSNLVIGKLEDSDQHIIYEDADLKDKLGFSCDTADSDFEYTEADLQDNSGNRALTDCVRIYFEVDYDIYVDKGSSTSNVSNFVTGLFNQVATLYANEQINIVLSPLVIWTQVSPYSSNSSSGMLNDFLANTGAFDGDLAQLLSYQASGGIAYVDGLCSSNPDYSKSFSSINPTYQNVPTYSWSVMVVTHEFGHLFGSQHTHACAWNNNNTAIDGCYTTEGNCPDPGIPSGGGTVMSYCHLTNVGINLNLGFGPQPGNLIRNRVQNASCTQACDDDGGGGDGGGDSCTDIEATLTILTDNYPGETTWTLKDASGATLYSGGPYSTQGQTYTHDFCLVDGCYDFQINDSYGDGICCGYGQGSYDIVMGGQTVASGGQFTNTEIVNFCTGDNPPPPPTCTDGVQNGNETGVDCGGPDCEPCESCEDGVLNNGETEVDCGGPNCDACPTCDDGVINGQETGVDCGGPDCDACPTCEDDIQNGDETGIDCGGSNCEPCDDGGGEGNEVFAHFFESGWDGWQDGGSDCYRYSGFRSYEGNYSIRIRDNSGTASAMTSSAYDLTGYSGVEVNFYFYPNSMENGEDFWLRYYDGNTWQTVAAFASGTSFQNNSFYVATVPILGNQYDMVSNAKFRFQCDASGNADRVYIDAVTVTGLTGSNLPSGEVVINKLQSTSEIDQFDFVEDVQISPNPANEQIRVKMNLDYAQEIKVEIYDILGKSIYRINQNVGEGITTTPIDISALNGGAYFMSVTDADGDQSVKKFIKIR